MSHSTPHEHGSLRRASILLRRGGAALLALALLALSLVALSSYQQRLQTLHDQAQLRMRLVQENLDRQGSLLSDYLLRLALWREDWPRLSQGQWRQSLDGYDEYALNADDHPGGPVASVWLRHGAKAMLPRVASILYLAYRKHQVSPWIGTAVLLDRRGSFVASYPPLEDGEFLHRALDWEQQQAQTRAGQVAWGMRLRQNGGQCDCLLASVSLTLPTLGPAVLLETISRSQLDRLFVGDGWFALLDGPRLLFASPGADLGAWRDIGAPGNQGVTEIEHRNGNILLKHRLRFMPWTLVYSPTRQNQPAPEWHVLPLYALPWLFGVLLFSWIYLALRRGVLAPTEAALATLQHYQQQLSDSNQTLLLAKEQAEQASQARALFLAVMSHEIRTPLNGVTAMLELLERGALDDDQRHALNLIKTSSELLLHVIGDILDFARIQSGKVEFALEPVWPLSLVNDLVETQRASLQLSGKPVELSVGGSIRASCCVLLDPFRLRQILGNLLSNALKFTERGSVCITLDYAQQRLCIEVRDSGIGMGAPQLERLFQPFVQADASTARLYGGSGLGLAIVKGLMDQAGGRIEVESQPGQGSLFRLLLPCPPAFPSPPPLDAPSERGAAARPAPHSRKGVVLVVEDHPINRETLGAQLRALGVNSCFVPSGARALAMLAQSPDVMLVLTDISMPEMDGFQLCAQIKAHPEWSRLPVVALTAHAFASDRERGLSVGMGDYLTKPLKLATLRAMLLRFGVPLAADGASAPPRAARRERLSPDIHGLLQLFQGDHAAVRKLIEGFIDCDQEDLQRLQQACVQRDRRQLGQIAHRMGSAALYLDARYAEALYAMEQQSSSTPWPKLDSLVEQLQQRAARLTLACRAWLAQD